MSIEQPGLRERKRLATRRAIQMAVLGLASEQGFDRVTVEEISAKADVSPRTFFNYFPSKESAAMGDAPALQDEAATMRFLSAGPAENLMTGIARLIESAIDTFDEDVELLNLRRGIMHAHPQLFAMRMASMRTFEDELSSIVEQRLRRDNPELAADPAALRDRARLATLVSMGAIRHAWSSWAESGGRGSLGRRIRDAFDGLRPLIAPERIG